MSLFRRRLMMAGGGNSYTITYPAKPTGVQTFQIYVNGILKINNPASGDSFQCVKNDEVYVVATQANKYTFPTVTNVSTDSNNPTIVIQNISIGVTEGFYSASFSSDSWEVINVVAQQGFASAYYSVGDSKNITMTTSEVITVVILGFNHDDLKAGGKAKMTIGMTQLLATRYPMNATATNAGGWHSSVMRTNTMATLLSQLPADLQAAIKQVNKKASAGSQSSSITTSADKLWLFSEVEVDNTTTAVYVNEGVQYDYWKTIKDGTVNANRIKYLSNGSDSAAYWYLRSAATVNSSYFHSVASSGGIIMNSADVPRGVSFAFCI